MSMGQGLGMGPSLSGPGAGADDRPRRGHRPRDAPVAAIPAHRPRGGRVPGDADARHGLPAPGLLHPDVQGPLGRDARRPRPPRHPRRPARRGRGPGAAPQSCAGSTPTSRTTCCSAPRPTTSATSRRCAWARRPSPTSPRWDAGSADIPSSSRAGPLRVRLVADDRLRYEPAARIIATCSAAGVSAIRLSPTGALPVRPGANGPTPPGPGPPP